MSEMGRRALAQSATADREIVISRVISAPRELVFEALPKSGTCRDGGDRRGSPPPPRGRSSSASEGSGSS
jgi:hypothetical protein